MTDIPWYIPPDRPATMDEFHEFIAPYYMSGAVAARVAHTTIHTGQFMVAVSTVFLPINHNFVDPDAYTILWETMVFGGPMDQYQDRYSSPEQATVGHIETVRECWAHLDLAGTPEVVTVTYQGSWWRPFGPVE